MKKSKKEGKGSSITLSQKLTVHNDIHRKLNCMPITIGVPWPEGKLKDQNRICAYDGEGRPVLTGVTTLNRWKDNSIQWTLLDFMTDFEPTSDRKFEIRTDKPAKTDSVKNRVAVKEGADGVAVSNGKVEIKLSEKGKEFIECLRVNGLDIVRGHEFDIVIKDIEGKEYSARNSPKRITIESNNPVKAVIKVEGKHTADDGNTLLDYWIKFTIYQGRNDIKCVYNFRNREKREPGIKLKAMTAKIGFDLSGEVRKHITHVNRGRFQQSAFFSTAKDMEIVTSDVVNVDEYIKEHKESASPSPKCMARYAEVLEDLIEEKPWFMRDVTYRGSGGERFVMPYLGLKDDKKTAVVFMKNMTGLYPKGLKSSENNVEIQFWPQWAGELPVTQGAGRTMEFVIAGLDGKADDMQMQTLYYSHEGERRTNIRIEPDIDWVRKCKVFYIDKLPAYEPEKHFMFERKIAHSWFEVGYGKVGNSGPNVPPPLGMWHYGDGGSNPMNPGVHTTNNEEMGAHPNFQDYLRSGRWEQAVIGIARAQHIIDVDYVDFSNDSYQRYGMVAHCTNHNNGAVYSSHQWFTELFMAYAITGDPEFKRCALNMCENLLFWINDETGFKLVASDERESGQPIINLTWAYEWNRDKRYIEGSMKIVKQALMTAEKLYGKIISAKPNREMPASLVVYGDYASYEGMFYLWEITKDKQLGDFILRQCEYKVRDKIISTWGGFRTTDINPAAYAYYISGDKKYMNRVRKSIKLLFKGANWQIGWIKSMFTLKIALDMGIIKDGDITL